MHSPVGQILSFWAISFGCRLSTPDHGFFNESFSSVGCTLNWLTEGPVHNQLVDQTTDPFLSRRNVGESFLGEDNGLDAINLRG